MKNILVVGGAGYIGSHTVCCLLDRGYAPVVADNLVYGHPEAIPPGVPFELVDLLNPATLVELFKKYHFDAVSHFAAFAYVGESVQDPQKYYRNNVVGVLNLLEAMLTGGVKNMVFSSTCATYGEPTYMPLDEKHPQHPINAYGQSKLMLEKICADYERAYGLRWIALRYFNVAGAGWNLGESHTPETHLIPLVYRAILNGEPVHVFGMDYDTPDGTCIRDYVHVADIAAAHCLAMKKLHEFTGAVNLGTSVGTSVKAIIAAAEKASGQKCPVIYAPRRTGDTARLFATNDKARVVLGWQPEHSLEEIMRSAWFWENNRRY